MSVMDIIILVDLGTVFVFMLFIIIVTVIAGATAVNSILNLFFGPFMYVAIGIILCVIIFSNISSYFKKQLAMGEKIINFFGATLATVIRTLALIFFVLVGLKEFSVLWNDAADGGDFFGLLEAAWDLFAVILFSSIIGIVYILIEKAYSAVEIHCFDIEKTSTRNIRMIVNLLINIIVAVVFACLVQEFVLYACCDTISEIFQDGKTFSSFFRTSWGNELIQLFRNLPEFVIDAMN
jgi:hypothetical protein